MGKLKVLDTKKQLIENVKNDIFALENQMKLLKEKQDNLKGALLSAMEKNGIERIENELFNVVYVPEGVSVGLDKKKLEKQFEEVYLQCIKKSSRKSYIKIMLNSNQ